MSANGASTPQSPRPGARSPAGPLSPQLGRRRQERRPADIARTTVMGAGAVILGTVAVCLATGFAVTMLFMIIPLAFLFFLCRELFMKYVLHGGHPGAGSARPRGSARSTQPSPAGTPLASNTPVPSPRPSPMPSPSPRRRKL